MEKIDIIYEDQELLVVCKPAGVLVHPTPANEPDTVVAWFLAKFPETKNLSWPDATRAGIVHRLDKDTSGLMILAKNPEKLAELQAKFKERDVQKTYQALVVGKTPEKGTVEAAIVRDGQNDKQKVQETVYSFTKGTVRPAKTDYKTIKYFTFEDETLSLIECYPHTGRMHQIRVHMKYSGFPLIGDQFYSTKLSNKLSKDLNLDRQFLHAVKLEIDGKTFESQLASDLQTVLTKLS